VFIYNGADFEPWVADVLASLSNKRLTIIEAGKGIARIAGDAHVWLSPLNAKIELRNIADGLRKADRARDTQYSDAYTAYADACDTLHDEYRAVLLFAHGKSFITVHAAFGYLAQEYGLTQMALTGASSEEEPSPLAMKKIIDYGRAHAISTVFYGEAAHKKLAESLAREIGAAPSFLHTLEGFTKSEIDAGEDYFSVMKKNLAALSVSF
jgi:zinc transport system substrate-binding protein